MLSFAAEFSATIRSSALPVRGLLNRNPWTEVQPCARRRSSCSVSSTPSAVVSIPSAAARSVIAFTIRDKIAASKAKGMWMGGTPPLGYKPSGRTLAIDEEQAKLVRLIHARYRELGTVRRLADRLAAENTGTAER